MISVDPEVVCRVSRAAVAGNRLLHVRRGEKAYYRHNKGRELQSGRGQVEIAMDTRTIDRAILAYMITHCDPRNILDLDEVAAAIEISLPPGEALDRAGLKMRVLDCGRHYPALRWDRN